VQQPLKGRGFSIKKGFHRRRNLDGTGLAGIDASFLAQIAFMFVLWFCHSCVDVGQPLSKVTTAVFYYSLIFFYLLVY